MKKELATDIQWLTENAPKTSGETIWETVDAEDKEIPVIACIHFCPMTKRAVFARIGIRDGTDWEPRSTYNYVFMGGFWRGVD